jgi:acyl dehydratase
MTRRFPDIAALGRAQGETLGVSDWVAVSQEMIDRFAEATGDFQWIHVDRDRAQNSPYGTTVAHGYLTLALIPRLRHEIFAVDGVTASINYGLDRLRFVAPVPSGSRVRLHLKLLRVEAAAQGARATLEATVECEGGARPALVAELITLLVAG